MSAFAFLFWFKVFTLVIIFFFIKTHKENEFYYYLNLGISKRFLWTTTLLFDMILFVGFSVVTAIVG